MFCSQCGRELPAGYSVCPACHPVAATPTAPVQPVPSYLWLGILTTICCCLPFGIVSIVYGAKVSSLAASGNIAAAQQASRNALIWGLVALICGLVSGGIWALCQALMVAAQNS